MRTASVPLKSVALPTEHGGWGFTLEPLLLGLLLSPGLPTLGLSLPGLLASPPPPPPSSASSPGTP